eukprot:5765733-Pleurochrysis_carterae.AAC.5
MQTTSRRTEQKEQEAYISKIYNKVSYVQNKQFLHKMKRTGFVGRQRQSYDGIDDWLTLTRQSSPVFGIR